MIRKVGKKLGASSRNTGKMGPKKKEEKRESLRQSVDDYVRGSISWEGLLAKEQLDEEEMAELCNEFDLMKSTVNEEDFDFSGEESSDDDYF